MQKKNTRSISGFSNLFKRDEIFVGVVPPKKRKVCCIYFAQAGELQRVLGCHPASVPGPTLSARQGSAATCALMSKCGRNTFNIVWGTLINIDCSSVSASVGVSAGVYFSIQYGYLIPYGKSYPASVEVFIQHLWLLYSKSIRSLYSDFIQINSDTLLNTSSGVLFIIE